MTAWLFKVALIIAIRAHSTPLDAAGRRGRLEYRRLDDLSATQLPLTRWFWAMHLLTPGAGNHGLRVPESSSGQALPAMTKSVVIPASG